MECVGFFGVAADVSLLGTGVVVHSRSAPVAWFSDDIADHDITRFSASSGDLAFDTVSEIWVVLVAFA
eukprot:9426494-Lingulodinium_polyedra.AAC.1